VTVIPADPGEKPAVVVTPGIPYFTVDNLAKTVKSGGPSLSIGMDSAGKGEKITVSGTIGAPGPAKPYYRRVEKPVMYAGTVLKTMLESGGIKVSGRVSGGKVPNNAALLYTHNSDPLSIIVRDMNKYSNNFTAEQVVKVLGAKPGVPASFSDGLAAIADGLQKFGVQGEYTMTNGSGLSHKNAFSARQIVQVLLHAWNSFVWGPDFVSSLSIGGDDGTVRKRYKGSFLEHSVRVKTGSIDRVSSLAGYLVSASGDPIAFCIIFNGFPAASCRDMTDLEDRIAEILSGSTIRER
jgi:D-alanyl-D-alanine carboxypeptidase/D-alanyl-D-alanine-endopeptidase (penicillin-binding protein 4)